MPPTPSFCEKQNTDGIVPLHAQNVKNETFTKIKSRKTQAFLEQAEIFTNRYFFSLQRADSYAILNLYPPPEASASGGLFLRLSMYRGLVLPRLSHQSANQRSVSDVPPAAYLFSRKRKDRGEKSAWTRLGRAAGTIQARIDFSVVTNTHSRPAGAMIRAACYGIPNL